MTDIVKRLRDLHKFNDRRGYGDRSLSVFSEAADEIERLRADAARWVLVRDHLASEWLASTPFDTDEWHFDPVVANRRGQSLTEIIDRLIEEKKCCSKS